MKQINETLSALVKVALIILMLTVAYNVHKYVDYSSVKIFSENDNKFTHFNAQDKSINRNKINKAKADVVGD